MHSRENVSDKDLNAAALKSMIHKTHTDVLNVQTIKLLPTEILNVLMLLVTLTDIFLVPHQHAMLANHAHQECSQTTIEDNATDISLLHAHAWKDMLVTVSDVKDAQKEQDHQLTTDNVSPWIVNQTKSLELTYNAQHVNGANQDQYQTQPEDSVSRHQDHQSLSELYNAQIHQYTTTIEPSVYHAQPDQSLIPQEPDVLVTVMAHLISSDQMAHASLAVMVMSQMQAEPDV